METAAPVTPESVASLREITKETVHAILRLRVSESQQKMVSTVAAAIARAHFERKLTFRAICADDTPVGFLMLYDDPDMPKFCLWTSLIDSRYQGLGFGRRAMGLLEEYVRSRPGGEMLELSYYPVEGGPEPFYRKLGYVPTGMDGNEVVAAKYL